MLRAIAGIIIGYLIFAVPSYLLFRLTHVDPHSPAPLRFETFSIIYGMVFSFLGGCIAVTVAHKIWVALTIAILIAAGAISSMIATGANWSPISALICMVPAALAGGWFRARQHRLNDEGSKS